MSKFIEMGVCPCWGVRSYCVWFAVDDGKCDAADYPNRLSGVAASGRSVVSTTATGDRSSSGSCK